jgi:hypothetical protein
MEQINMPRTMDHKNTDSAFATAEQIASGLRFLTKGFPKEALKAAQEHQKEITPLLLNFLNHITTNYQTLEQNYFGHLYAMFLLAQFREKQAFPLIMQIASLPGDWPEIILGDTLTEDLHRIIASVFNGDLLALQQVIENPDLNSWSRDATIQSLLVLVQEKIIEREWVIEYFKSLFNHPTFTNNEEVMDYFILAATYLYPVELYDLIKAVLEQNNKGHEFIFMDMKEVDAILQMGQEAALKKYLYHEKYSFIADAIDILEGWVCFQENKTYYNNDRWKLDHFDWELEDEDNEEDNYENYVRKMPYYRETPKIGRNDPCLCGSGKKYKKCCAE